MRKKSFQKSAENLEKSLFSMKNRVFMVVDEVWTQCGRSVAVKSPENLGKTLKKIKLLHQKLFSAQPRGGPPPLIPKENNFWEEL